MTLREARAAAVRRRYRDLCDSLTEALPGLLDELDAIDRQAQAADQAEMDLTAAEMNRLLAENPAPWTDGPKPVVVPAGAPGAAGLPDVTSVPESAPERIARTAPARAARRPRRGAAT